MPVSYVMVTILKAVRFLLLHKVANVSNDRFSIAAAPQNMRAFTEKCSEQNVVTGLLWLFGGRNRMKRFPS